MTLLKGFDVNRDCGGAIHRIVEAKVAFAARYYLHSPRKNLTPSEAKLLSGAGIKLVTVWEAAGSVVTSFSYATGTDDGTSAYNQAVAVGQPASTPIYFAVDFDADEGQVAGAIHNYFQGLKVRFRVGQPERAGLHNWRLWFGTVCSRLKERNLVTHMWLAMSRGWRVRDLQ